MNTTQERPSIHAARERLRLETGDRIGWTGPDGPREDEVRATGVGWITCINCMVDWDAQDLRVVRRRDASANKPVVNPVPQKDVWVRNIALADLRPFRFQARTQFDDAELLELAESIAKRGVDQPVGVRDNPDWLQDPQQPRFELIYGERRYRACALAGLVEIPARDYGAIDDDEAMERHLDENEKRSQLSPLERAAVFHRMQTELGWSQERIGERFGLSQERVSRTIALAQLPAPVLELIRGDRLTATHGQELLKWRDRPAICGALAEKAASDGWTVAKLRSSLEDWTVRRDLVKVNVVKDLCEAVFDWKTVCKGCPNLVEPNGYTHWCAAPAEFDQKQKDARKARKAEEKAATEKALAQIGGSPKDAGYVNIKSLKTNTFLDLTQSYGYAPNYIQIPATCKAEGCSHPCRGMAWDGKKAVPVCLDPKACVEEGKRIVRDAQSARRREVDEIAELAHLNLAERQEIGSRELALVGLPMLWSMTSEEIAALVAAAGIPVDASKVRAARGTVALDEISKLPPMDLMRLLVMAVVRVDSREFTSSEAQRPWRLRWYAGVEREPPNNNPPA